MGFSLGLCLERLWSGLKDTYTDNIQRVSILMGGSYAAGPAHAQYSACRKLQKIQAYF
jgi:hypothetical protein